MKFSGKTIAVESLNDLPEKYKSTPIEDLFAYHQFKKKEAVHDKAELVIVKCMDHRENLKIPGRFSYIIRSPGARIMGNEFALSFPIGMSKIKFVALIAHTDCGMVGLSEKKATCVQGLQQTLGWNKEDAELHFNSYAPFYAIDNESEFVCMEAKRLRVQFPNINFVPILFNVEDKKLYLLME